jgi:hypothetical protein
MQVKAVTVFNVQDKVKALHMKIEMWLSCLDCPTDMLSKEFKKNVSPFTFCSRIRRWEDVTVDEFNVVLALFYVAVDYTKAYA